MLGSASVVLALVSLCLHVGAGVTLPEPTTEYTDTVRTHKRTVLTDNVLTDNVSPPQYHSIKI